MILKVSPCYNREIEQIKEKNDEETCNGNGLSFCYGCFCN